MDVADNEGCQQKPAGICECKIVWDSVREDPRLSTPSLLSTKSHCSLTKDPDRPESPLKLDHASAQQSQELSDHAGKPPGGELKFNCRRMALSDQPGYKSVETNKQATKYKIKNQ